MGKNSGESILSKVFQGWSEGVSLAWGPSEQTSKEV